MFVRNSVCPYMMVTIRCLVDPWSLFLGTFPWKRENPSSLPRYFCIGNGIVKNMECETMGLSRSLTCFPVWPVPGALSVMHCDALQCTVMLVMRWDAL